MNLAPQASHPSNILDSASPNSCTSPAADITTRQLLPYSIAKFNGSQTPMSHKKASGEPKAYRLIEKVDNEFA
jgi:hypothetical protein